MCLRFYLCFCLYLFSSLNIQRWVVFFFVFLLFFSFCIDHQFQRFFLNDRFFRSYRYHFILLFFVIDDHDAMWSWEEKSWEKKLSSKKKTSNWFDFVCFCECEEESENRFDFENEIEFRTNKKRILTSIFVISKFDLLTLRFRSKSWSFSERKKIVDYRWKWIQNLSLLMRRARIDFVMTSKLSRWCERIDWKTASSSSTILSLRIDRSFALKRERRSRFLINRTFAQKSTLRKRKK